jgi:hypothetical protein
VFEVLDGHPLGQLRPGPEQEHVAARYAAIVRLTQLGQEHAKGVGALLENPANFYAQFQYLYRAPDEETPVLLAAMGRHGVRAPGA